MATETKEANQTDAAEDHVTANDAAVNGPEPEPNPEAAAKAKKGKYVRLRDQETGFFDPATGFQVVRDQEVELTATIGQATNEALISGRLLIVGGK